MRSNDHGDAPYPPRGDPKSMVAKNMIGDDLGAPKGLKIEPFMFQNASKNTSRTCSKFGIEKTLVLC